MKELLATLVTFLKLNSYSVEDNFNPPIDSSKLITIMKMELKVFPEELVALYNWKDGNKINDEEKLDSLTFSSWGIFIPFKQSLDYFKELNKNSLSGEYSTLLPIFQLFSGETVFYDLSPNTNKPKIYLKYGMSNSPIPIFNKLQDMFFAINELYKNNIFFYENGIFKYRYIEYSNFMKKSFPKIKYWSSESINDLIDGDEADFLFNL